MGKQAQSGSVEGALRIGLAGLGTVGTGVLEVLASNREVITARAGRPIEVVAVSARDRGRDRGVPIDHLAWRDNAVDLAALDDVDIVVELIGGSDGPALALARAALDKGLGFVTANKALMAIHGEALAALAEKTGSAMRFEAAVAGGIPILKALNEGLAANRTTSVYGILNGTCNYILTRMERTGEAFDAVLADAQRLGYAEADPSFDVDGIDTAHKTAILAAQAFGIVPSLDAMLIEGITAISRVDIDYARELGYRIKLLGVARRVDDRVDQRVNPTMVPLDSALAGIDGATNAVVVQGDFVGQTVYEGQGAGAGPTASAVVADLIDIARCAAAPAFGVRSDTLDRPDRLASADRQGRFYIRLRVHDRPGVIADVSATLRDQSVSVQSLIQRGEADNGGVYLVLATHLSPEGAVSRVVDALAALDSVLDPPTMLRIEDFD